MATIGPPVAPAALMCLAAVEVAFTTMPAPANIAATATSATADAPCTIIPCFTQGCEPSAAFQCGEVACNVLQCVQFLLFSTRCVFTSSEDSCTVCKVSFSRCQAVDMLSCKRLVASMWSAPDCYSRKTTAGRTSSTV